MVKHLAISIKITTFAAQTEDTYRLKYIKRHRT